MAQVPRYTSYPTAPNFHDAITGEIYKSWLANLSENTNLSLYFHIPFCRQLCWFCGCHTKIINGYSPVTHYMDFLKSEVALVANNLNSKNVSHIHFGGGSPTILSGSDFKDFMALLRDHFIFTKDAELAIEIDPRTADKHKIKAYAETGINRASLGVQDFDITVQRTINRVQSFELVENVINKLRANQIKDINVDLIYGLPNQTTSTLNSTINQTLDLQPNRISLFGYAHVPWMKKHQNLIPAETLPDQSARMEMFDNATEQLQNAGYLPIGLDHFVKPEDALAVAEKSKCLNRNFQGYTTDNSDTLLGLGISSISTLPTAYIQNTSDFQKYSAAIASGNLPIARGIQLNNEDIERRGIIMSLMCNRTAQIDPKKYSEELSRLNHYIKNNEATYQDGILEISKTATHKLRLIASVFDQYLLMNEHKYSQAV